MFKRVLAITVFAVLCASTARAEVARTLKEQCSAGDRMLCAAYVAGVIDTLRMLSYKTAGGFFCSPQGTRPEDYILVVTKYLSTHPDGLKYNASDEVMLALAQAFPCERVGEHPIPLPPETTEPLPPRGK
jgi:hypothetical protein